MVERVYVLESYASKNIVRYVAIMYGAAHPASQKKFGQMTKEEAEAMAKLLNASTTD